MKEGKASLEWFCVQDPATGCFVFVRELADGRYAVQFDDRSEFSVKTREELLTETRREGIPDDDMRFVPAELLRRHINEHFPVQGNA